VFVYAPASLGFGVVYSAQQLQTQQLIQQAASAYDVPDLSSVALAVAQHESQFIPTAQNPSSSAAGVFQLMSTTQSSLGVTNPYDPTQNVDAGVGLLAQYYNQYGNWPQALQAFSDGPGTVQQGLAPSSQTNNLLGYVQTQTGLNLSGSDSSSSPVDLSSLGITLPDLSGFSISDALGFTGIPDWATWAGIALLGFAAVGLASRS
jgi:hypothetical protein